MSTVSAGLGSAEPVGDDEPEVQRAAGAAERGKVGFCAVALESVTLSGPVVTGSPGPSTWVHA